jgi:hypothetical protein
MTATVIPFPRRGTLTPAANDAVAVAFDKAWRVVRSAGPTAPGDLALARSRIAAAILAMAEHGEVDPNRMMIGALDALLGRTEATPPVGEGPPQRRTERAPTC